MGVGKRKTSKIKKYSSQKESPKPLKKPSTRKQRRKFSKLKIKKFGSYIKGRFTRKRTPLKKRFWNKVASIRNRSTRRRKRRSPSTNKKSKPFTILTHEDMMDLNNQINEGTIKKIKGAIGKYKKVFKTKTKPVKIITQEEFEVGKDGKLTNKAYKEDSELIELFKRLYSLPSKCRKYLLLPTHFGTINDDYGPLHRYMEMSLCRELDYFVWKNKEKDKRMLFSEKDIKTNLIGLLETVHELHEKNITCLDIKMENIFVDCGKKSGDRPYFVLGDVDGFKLCKSEKGMFSFNKCIMTQSWYAGTAPPFSDFYAILLMVVIIYNDTVRKNAASRSLYNKIWNWVAIDQQNKTIKQRVKILEEIQGDKWEALDKVEKFILLAIKHCLEYESGRKDKEALDNFYQEHIMTIIGELKGEKTEEPEPPSNSDLEGIKLTLSYDGDSNSDSDDDWDIGLLNEDITNQKEMNK